MSAETWATYQIMITRTTAICSAIGQKQFRAMAEMTINNLMQSVREQITVVQELSDQQKHLKVSTFEMDDQLSQNHGKLLAQQMDMLTLSETQK